MDFVQVDILLQRDKEGSSDLFDSARDAVHELNVFGKYDLLKIDEVRNEKERQGLWRRYALIRKKAHEAVLAYLAKNDHYHVTDKGNRRRRLCQDALKQIEAMQEPKYEEMDLETSVLQRLNKQSHEDEKQSPEDEKQNPENDKENLQADKKKAEFDELELLSSAAFREAGEMSWQPLKKEEVADLYIKHRRLHRLLEPSDDIGFLTHYLENRQILENFIHLADVFTPPNDRITKLGINAKIYERYFDTRIQMLASPVYRVLKEKKVSFPEKEKEEEFLKLYGLDQRHADQYRILDHEMKKLSSVGVAPAPKLQADRRDFTQGTIGSKTFNGSASFLTGKYEISKSILTGVSLNGKVRLGKLGSKINSKYFKASASLGFGAAETFGYAAVSTPKFIEKSLIPNAKIYGRGKAYGAKARMKFIIGGKNNNILFRPNVTLGSAYGAMLFNIGKNTWRDEEGNEISENGAKIGGKFQLSALSGSVKTGFSVLGFKFNFKVKGYLGGVAGDFGIEATSGRMKFSIGAALGLGADVTLEIDWSQAVKSVKNFYYHSKRIKKEVRDQKILRNLGSKHMDSKELDKVIENEQDDWKLISQVEDDTDRFDEVKRKLQEEQKDADGFYRQTLDLALSKLDTLSTRVKDENLHQTEISGKNAIPFEAADEAMAALVCANIMRIQKKMDMKKKHQLFHAVHTSENLANILKKIQMINEKQPSEQKFWDFSTPEKFTFDQDNINKITKSILTMSHNPENGKQKAESNPGNGKQKAESNPENGKQKAEYNPENGEQKAEYNPENGKQKAEYNPENGKQKAESNPENGKQKAEHIPDTKQPLMGGVIV